MCKGALNHLFNYFQPTMKLASKERAGTKVGRTYGETLTPLARVQAGAVVSAATMERLRAEKWANNLFALLREIERQLKVIEQHRRRAAQI